MACGDNSDNQMRLKDVDEYLPDFPSAGSYRFRVSVADDGTLPNGVSTLYRIRPYKSDGTTIYQGPWGHDGYLTDLSWTMNVNSPDGGSYFAISAVEGKENTYKISSYKKDGTMVRENIFGTSNWIFCTISKKSSSDPLQDQKDALQDAINLANKCNSFAKTTASWKTLQDAISNGEAELENASTTAELLNAATTAINDAIAGLKLEDGYTNLTKEMYYSWDSATSPSEGSVNLSCDYVLNSSTSQPYGDGNVPLLSFADLSTFDTFYILTTGGGLPRILLNRDVNEGQWNATEADSHLIDNTKGDANSWHAKYFNTSGGNVTVDLKQLATDKNFAHLHTIKALGSFVVSDMLLYRTLTVGSTGYATFGSLYKNAKPNSVTAYAAKYEDGQVTLTPVTNVPAGKGVVIMGDPGSYAPTFDVAAGDIDSDLKVSNGTVVGDGSTIYVLNKVADKVGFYLLKAGKTLEAGKAYLKIEDGVAKARAFIGISGMDVTGISTVKQAEGKKDDVIYNLNGQRVSNPRKGLFIKNGVKFLVD